MNMEFEYFKSCAKIAKESLTTMALLWEQMQFNDDEPSVIRQNYFADESFDEFVFKFSEWVSSLTE